MNVDGSSDIVAIDRNAPRDALVWSAPLDDVCVSLGGCVFRFVSAHPQVAFTLSNRFELFRVAQSREAQCTIRWSAGPVERCNGRLIQHTSLWETRRSDCDVEQTVFFMGEERRPYLDLTFKDGYETAEITQLPEMIRGGVGPDLHPLSEFLIGRVLSRKHRAEVHASGVIANGGAYLFVGHSGAGKTTISRIAELAGATVLSDDRIIFGMSNGRPRVWGTPWHGSGAYTSPDSGELVGIFLLRQADANALRPAPYAEAIKEVFVRLVQVRVDPEEVLNTHAVLEEVLTVVPSYEFSFRPTLAAFALAQRAVFPASD
jgi:hypothetical protein